MVRDGRRVERFDFDDDHARVALHVLDGDDVDIVDFDVDADVGVAVACGSEADS